MFSTEEMCIKNLKEPSTSQVFAMEGTPSQHRSCHFDALHRKWHRGGRNVGGKSPSSLWMETAMRPGILDLRS